MMRRVAAIVVGSLSLSALALSAALAGPCRQKIAACARSECAERRGQERRFCLAICGGRAGCPLGGPAPIRTLAYVVTECRDGPEGFSSRQALRVRRGDHEPITIAESPALGPVDLSSLADAFRGDVGVQEAMRWTTRCCSWRPRCSCKRRRRQETAGKTPQPSPPPQVTARSRRRDRPPGAARGLPGRTTGMAGRPCRRYSLKSPSKAMTTTVERGANSDARENPALAPA